MSRQSYSKEFKARVALDALKGQKTVSEIASEYKVHSTQVALWKKKAVEGMAESFARGKSNEVESLESERDRLYQKVGQLQVEVDWLKKFPGLLLVLIWGELCLETGKETLMTCIPLLKWQRNRQVWPLHQVSRLLHKTMEHARKERAIGFKTCRNERLESLGDLFREKAWEH